MFAHVLGCMCVRYICVRPYVCLCANGSESEIAYVCMYVRNVYAHGEVVCECERVYI